jgi:hypothetical protein
VGVTQRQEAEDFDESRTVGRVEWGIGDFDVEARGLEETIAKNVAMLLEQNF